MVLTGDTGLRLAIICIRFVGMKRQMIDIDSHAFILIPLLRERSVTKPDFARSFVNRYLSILKVKYFWTLELKMINFINYISEIVLPVYNVYNFQ